MLISWRYKFRNSIMDKIDPRARWIFSFAFLLSATMFWNATFLFILFILAIIWYSFGKTKWKETRHGWFLVSIMLFSMIVINTIITGGGAGGVVPPGGHVIWPQEFTIPLVNWEINFGLTVERLWFSLCQLMRLGGISLIFLLIPYTMDSRAYGATFHGLGMPDSVAYTMELAIRFIPTLARDLSVTLDAQKARGYEIEKVKGGIFKKIARIAPLLVPVTMNAIIGSEDVANAMDLRCFGQAKRTWIYPLEYHWWDYVLIGFSALMLVGSILAVHVFHLGGFWTPEWFMSLFV
jgi:energy-coupling factor transport system permease protein